jgi:hypothetical protein
MSDKDPSEPEPSADEPKIIVDDDWKEQVAKEKELEREATEGRAETESQPAGEAGSEPRSEAGDESPSAEEPDAAASPQTESEPSAGGANAPPPASFEVLVSMLFTQAMSLLGQMPDPSTGETKVNKAFAKHTIDTLEMLSEKTSGNLSEDEQKILSEALHALRMTFVSVQG